MYHTTCHCGHHWASVKLTLQASEQAVKACNLESAAEGGPSEQHQVNLAR